MHRRPHSLTGLALVGLSGCATVYSLPTPMGGVRVHAEVLGIGRDGAYDDIGRGLWFLFLPLTLSDLALSLCGDVALLPITGLLALQEWRQAHEPEPMPRPRPAPPNPVAPPPAAPPPPVAPVAPPPALRLTVGVVPDVDVSSVVTEYPVARPDALALALEVAARAPYDVHDRARLARLGAALAGGVREDGLDLAIDADPTCATPWVARGWARLLAGDLARAEADLWLGEALSRGPLDRARATVGLARVAEALRERDAALAGYRHVLARPEHLRALDGAEADDLRRRVAALEAR